VAIFRHLANFASANLRTSAIFNIQKTRVAGSNPTSPQSKLYLITGQSTRPLLEQCASEPYEGSLTKIPIDQIPSDMEWLTSWGNEDVGEVYLVSTPFHCILPSRNMFWQTIGSGGVYRSPSVEYLPSTRTSATAPEAGRVCVSVELMNGPGISVDSKPEIVKDKDTGRAFQESDYEMCSNGETMIQQDEVSVAYTDTALESLLTRNLFFAGIFLGAVGALLIEVLVLAFDLAEERAGRDPAEAHVTDERSEGDPPDWEPDPRSYL
jgi:hypothetical protein